ncbi:MAG: 50S ribosomal protein L13 [Planctomycetota bacterium]|jgi:large subunit ribosomal protein L13
MRTSHVRAADLPERWLLFDASKEPVGRMASKIAVHLMGKDRPEYTPSELCGAHVVVINAEQAVFTGKKEEQKSYPFYSGYPGGLNEIDLPTMRERRPADVVTLAVRRMLPKNRLGRQMLARLKVYAGEEHPHTAQKPEAVN